MWVEKGPNPPLPVSSSFFFGPFAKTVKIRKKSGPGKAQSGPLLFFGKSAPIAKTALQ